MRTQRVSIIVLVAGMLAAAASAADIGGQWKAQFKTNYGTDLQGNPLPRENGETTFTFRQNGEELTGTVTSTAFPETQIREGKVNGDQISFALMRKFGGRERKMIYTGTVTGNEISFKTSIEGFGRGVQMVAKKVH